MGLDIRVDTGIDKGLGRKLGGRASGFWRWEWDVFRREAFGGKVVAVVSTGRATQVQGYRPGLVGPGLVRNTYTFPIKKVVVRGGRKIKGSSTILGSVAYTNGRLLKLVLYLTAARLLKPSASLHTRRSAVE